MKVFVTGATGFIGSVVTDVLLKDGHTVVGLARSDAGLEKLRAKGIEAVKGDLTTLDILKEQAAQADAVIHLAFIHDFSIHQQAIQTDGQVIGAFLDALEGSKKHFIATSGSALLGDRPDHPDETEGAPDKSHLGRMASEILMSEGAKRGVTTSMVRLPMFVYDKHGAAFTKPQEAKADALGHAIYIGDGTKATNVVHVSDAAALYAHALTKATPGGVYHAVNGSVTYKQVAEAIAAKRGIGAQSVTPEQAVEIYGAFFARFFQMNTVVDSRKTRSELDWRPVRESGDLLKALAGKAES